MSILADKPADVSRAKPATATEPAAVPWAGGRGADAKAAGTRISRFMNLHSEGATVSRKPEEQASDGDEAAQGEAAGAETAGDEAKAPDAGDAANGNPEDEKKVQPKIRRKIHRTTTPGAPAPGAGAASVASDPAVAEADRKARADAASLQAAVNDINIKLNILVNLTIPAVDSLSAEVAMAAFISASEQMFARWDELSSPAARIHILGDAALEALSSVGVPHPSVETIGGLASTFNKGTWAIAVGTDKFATKPTRDALMSACTTVYHEARHAEQYWKMARMLAGQGKTAAQIKAETGVKEDIANQAQAISIPPTDAQLQLPKQILAELQKPETKAMLKAIEDATREYMAETDVDKKSQIYRAKIRPLKTDYERVGPEADAFKLEADVEALDVKIREAKARAAAGGGGASPST